MISLLNRLNVQKKLLLPVTFQLLMIVLVVFIFLGNRATIDNSKASLAGAAALINELETVYADVRLYAEGIGSSEKIKSRIDKINVDLARQKIANSEEIKAQLSRLTNHLETIEKSLSSNRQVNSEIMHLTEKSIEASNQYIQDLTALLVDEYKRFDVSTGQRMVLAGALINTDSNHRVRFLFKRLEHDITAADELSSFLDLLISNTVKDAERAEGTPFHGRVIAALEVNRKIKQLVSNYIENAKIIDRAQNNLVSELDQMLGVLDQFQNNNIQSVFAKLSQSSLAIVGLLMVSTILIIAVTLLVGRSVVLPLRELGGHIEALARSGGDLTFRIDLHRQDEIGSLAVGVNQFLEKLQSIFVSVTASSRQISGQANDAEERSRATAAMMKDQMAQTSEVAAAVNQMETAIGEVAKNADTASNAAKCAETQTATALATIEQAVKSITSLSQDITNATEVIGKLEQDSQNIGGILDVIREIAAQTNLLALNAAIEAARAGEQGRGFAVVADEVRSLAQRTQSSIEEINAMIGSLQSAAVQAASVMEAGYQQINKSVAASNDAGAGLQEVSSAISSISQMNLLMASAVEEQNAVVREINGSVKRISDLAKNTNDSAVSASGSATQQMQSAKHLLELIGQFRT